MSELSQQLETSLAIGLLLAFVRVSMFVSFLPLFGGQPLPKTVKIGLAMSLLGLSGPDVMASSTLFADVSWAHLAWLVIRESSLGAACGWLLGMIFVPVRIAGSLIAQEMGLTIATLTSSTGDAHSNVVSELLDAVVVLAFLSINGHHLFFRVLEQSWTLFPVGGSSEVHNLWPVGKTIVEIEALGVSLAAPIVFVLLITTGSLLFVMRQTPSVQSIELRNACSLARGSDRVGDFCTRFDSLRIVNDDAFPRHKFLTDRSSEAMAEEFDQNKTEEPTVRRRERAREEGEVLFSPDLTAGVTLLAMTLLAFLFGSQFVDSLSLALEESITRLRRTNWGIPETISVGQWFLSRAMATAGVVAGTTIVIALGVTQIQSGLTFTVKPISPNWEKISLSKGWSRLLSIDSFFRGVLSVLKLSSSVTISIVFVCVGFVSIRKLAALNAISAIESGGEMATRLLLSLACGSLVWGAVDFGFRRYRHELKLRMSKQEVKDEQKDDQGDPQVRARIRRAQLESLQRRALTEVPRATMVITNPTHFAVAIRYETGRMNAPVVVAKGKDLFARRIAKIARESGIPVLERKPLTRAIFALANVGDEIPVEFYRAIAELLAHVYRIKGGVH